MTAHDVSMVGIGVVVGLVLGGTGAVIGVIWAIMEIKRKGGGR
jgi:hypothetical protein